MVKIKFEDLQVDRIPDFTGGYGIFPKHLIIQGDEKKKKVLELTEKVRVLLRVEDNLRETYEVLNELEKRLKGEIEYSPRTDTANYALFTQAAVVYGACFVTGKDRKRPIDYFDKTIRESPQHKSYMIYRDKLFCHFDEDHEVRSEPIKWVFELKNDKIVPRFGSNAYSRISMISSEEVNEWKMFANSILQNVWRYNKEVMEEVNELLGHLEIEQ